MTAHDAAVRAVAETLPRLRFVAHPSDPYYSLMLDTDRAREVIAALTTSADVRAALSVNKGDCGHGLHERHVDAVMAALGGAS